MQTTVRTRMPLDELARLPTVFLPSVSWDGARVAYYSDVSGRMEIWIMDLASGETRQVTSGQIPRSVGSPFTWNRAGTAIVFAKDRAGDEQHDLWLLDLASSTATQLTNTPGFQEYPLEFSPDDRWISFLSTRDGQLNLYKMRSDGSEQQQLTRFAFPVSAGGTWSPDGTRLLAASNESADPRNLDVYMVPAGGSAAEKIFSTGTGTKDFPAAWSPDGRWIALTSDESGVNRAGIFDLQSGEVRWLGPEGIEEMASAFSPDGRLLLAVRNQDAAQRPVVYEVETGAERVPTLPAGGSLAMAMEAAFAEQGRSLILRYSTDATRPALVRYELEESNTQTLIEPAYGSIDPSSFVMAEDVVYSSFDGLRIPALLYRPRHISEGTRVPAIVMPHGGPTGQYFHGFSIYTQFLVNEGYVVLAPNIRGSTGYGVEFRDMALHDWGGADLKDIVAGRDYLASLPFVDPDRMAVFGISYGGYMTYIATTRAPDKWKAGAAWVGITDLKALYDESMPHFKYYLEQQMGKPEENADLWADRSAANFAGQLQARLLIIHGTNDPRCPISQARIFRDRLIAAGKQEGVDFEYVELGEEGHGSTDQEQRLRAFQLLADFLSRTL